MIRIGGFCPGRVEANGTMTRRDKINYYLDIAETVLTRGTCTRRFIWGDYREKQTRSFPLAMCGAPRAPGQLHRFGLLHPGQAADSPRAAVRIVPLCSRC